MENTDGTDEGVQVRVELLISLIIICCIFAEPELNSQRRYEVVSVQLTHETQRMALTRLRRLRGRSTFSSLILASEGGLKRKKSCFGWLIKSTKKLKRLKSSLIKKDGNIL